MQLVSHSNTLFSGADVSGEVDLSSCFILFLFLYIFSFSFSLSLSLSLTRSFLNHRILATVLHPLYSASPFREEEEEEVDEEEAHC